MARDPQAKLIFVARDTANTKLINALRHVRDLRAAGADDWECKVLNIFVKYLEAIGGDEDLRRLPMQMYFAKQQEIERARRRRAGKSGATAPYGKMEAMAFAAAAVTVLKRQGQGSIPEMLNLVARTAGIDRRALENFRDNINRGLLARASESYNRMIGEIEAAGWRPAKIIKNLKNLDEFVS